MSDDTSSVNSIALRPYQERAVVHLREKMLAGCSRIVFVLPTGGGKTVTFAYMAAAAAAKGNDVLILAHRDPLIEQISETLTAFGVAHGVIQSGRSMNRLPVQVGMVATVANRLAKLRVPKLIIIDEGHHATAATYLRVLKHFPGAKVLIVTATPARTDGRGLAEMGADAMVIGPTMKELIAAGHLSPYRLFCPPSGIDLTGIKTTAGDYKKDELARRVDRSEIIGNAVDHYRKYAQGLTFCTFCASREHALHTAQAFTAAGIPTRNIDGTMGRPERDEILGQLRSGAIVGITSVDLVGEGFDLPRIACVIGLRPTQSLIVHLQTLGRALRPAPGKDCAVILDHAGNTLRHGLPDQDREWTLEGRPKGQRQQAEQGISVRHCGVCFAVFPGSLKTCPHCSSEAEVKARKIEERDGELIEITREMEVRESFEARIAGLSTSAAMRICRTPDDIKALMKARGLKPGWGVRRVMEIEQVGPQAACVKLGYHPGLARHLGVAQ